MHKLSRLPSESGRQLWKRLMENPSTLFNTPSQLFKPAVITAENLKAEVVDKGFESAKNLCTGRYAEGCKRLGIQ